MKQIIKNQKGTSLIELILYIALLSLVLIVVIDLVITSGALKQETDSKSSLEQDEAYLSSRLSYEIKQADAVTTPASIGQTTTSLVLTIGTETHTVSLSGNNLQFQKTIGVSTSSASLNTSLTKVSSFSVQRLGNPTGKASFRISFTLADLKTTQQGTLTKNFEVVANLR